jgi:hypothetical protein
MAEVTPAMAMVAATTATAVAMGTAGATNPYSTDAQEPGPTAGLLACQLSRLR